ncbi:hypothetical protein Zmor_024311 [Zophobas morio]|uniref:Uncharacterized protein n=2 Tax=Zophobas morio TaxID=2755281 RepID=A0AA38I2T9_9CUCU|nr:hypothetical protein Zmor_024311 [Zophobas morio]
MSRQLGDRTAQIRRQIRSTSLDRKLASLDRSRDSGRVLTEKRDRSTPVDSDRRREVRSLSSDRVSDLRDIRVLERRLTREDDRRSSDATRRILTLSSKDENNNFARTDKRQSIPEERRMATSFRTDVNYIPGLKSGSIFNAAQLVLLSLLVAQVVSNSSKAKKNWFLENNFVTVTKEKVL